MMVEGVESSRLSLLRWGEDEDEKENRTGRQNVGRGLA